MSQKEKQPFLSIEIEMELKAKKDRSLFQKTIYFLVAHGFAEMTINGNEHAIMILDDQKSYSKKEIEAALDYAERYKETALEEATTVQTNE